MSETENTPYYNLGLLEPLKPSLGDNEISVEGLKALFSDHSIPEKGWDDGKYQKLAKSLNSGGYSLMESPKGLTRVCYTLRNYVLVDHDGSSYVLREGEKTTEDKTKRNWAIESSMGEKRDGQHEELGAWVTRSLKEELKINDPSGLKAYHLGQFVIHRESQSAPGLDNYFCFEDNVIVVGGEHKENELFIPGSPTILVEGNTRQGWELEKIASETFINASAQIADSLSGKDYPLTALQAHYLRRLNDDINRAVGDGTMSEPSKNERVEFLLGEYAKRFTLAEEMLGQLTTLDLTS